MQLAHLLLCPIGHPSPDGFLYSGESFQLDVVSRVGFAFVALLGDHVQETVDVFWVFPSSPRRLMASGLVCKALRGEVVAGLLELKLEPCCEKHVLGPHAAGLCVFVAFESVDELVKYSPNSTKVSDL